MKAIKDIALFLLANAIGFFAAPISYHLAVFWGWISPAALTENSALFQQSFFSGTITTWLICCAISFMFFLLDGKVRYAFLLLSILGPFIYGLYVLSGFATVSSAT